jgi:hypothetical protein
MITSIAAAVDAVFRAPARDRPRPTHAMPHRCIDHRRIAGLQGDVRRAGAVGEKEHALPGGAPISRPIHSARRPGRKWIAQHRRVGDGRIGRMHDDRADLARIAQPHEAPGAARVHGFVDAAADGHVTADRVRSGADVDDAGVAVRDADCPDGRRGERLVPGRAPRDAGVGGFPDTATGGAEVEGGGLLGHAGDRGRASPAAGTDHAIAEARQARRVVCRKIGGGGRPLGGSRGRDQRERGKRTECGEVRTES